MTAHDDLCGMVVADTVRVVARANGARGPRVSWCADDVIDRSYHGQDHPCDHGREPSDFAIHVHHLGGIEPGARSSLLQML